MLKHLFLAGALLTTAACDQQFEATRHAVAACRAPLKPAVQVDLYFGRDKGVKGEVTESEWSGFVAEVVTPRFPDGLTMVDINGQFRDPTSGRVVRERGKLLIVVVFDAPKHVERFDQVIAAYNSRFGQHSVFRTERPVCAGSN